MSTMSFQPILRTISMLLCAGFAFNALASSPDDAAFMRDRDFAQKSLSDQQRQQCISDVVQKMKFSAAPSAQGAFHFNESISRDVYHTLYWKGDRGVAFTVPVTLSDPQKGKVSHNLACFYALEKNGMIFQYSQLINRNL